MLTGEKHRTDSDSRGQDVRESHLHPELWDRSLGRTGSRHRAWPWQLHRDGTKRQQLFHSEYAEHETGLSGWRASRRRWRQSQRRHKALGFSFFVCLIMACGLACTRRESPQAAFDRTYKIFLHGDLIQSQEDADREYQRLRDSNPQWAWKFRILEAESLLWRGMYAQVLAVLNSGSVRPNSKDSLIEILAIEGVAHARLHQFPEAEEKLGRATQMCHESGELTCGDVIRARGVLSVQHGQIDAAKRFFEQSLEFARAHHDPFLEATALLNMGLTSLREEHFDEAIDWTNAAYQASTDLGAGDIAQTAVGNLGWAYYNLGDSERSLALSLKAEKLASQVG